MTNDNKENSLTAENSAVSLNNSEMSLEQLNEYIILRASDLCEKSKRVRAEYDKRLPMHTTDIVPPYCNSKGSPYSNIEQIFNCYNNTLMAGLFYETEVIKFQAKSHTFFSFLSKNDLIEKFDEFVYMKNFNKN